MERNDFIKITEDMYYDIYDEQGTSGVRNLLTSQLRHYETACVADYDENLLYSLVDCESPIEQALAMEMERMNIQQMSIYNPLIDDVIITKQEEIEAQGKKYRPDFTIAVIYKKDKNDRKDVYYKTFVIECDGYEFHQKTKEQVERDNTRMRTLQKEGYEVIRFSGSEIYKSARNCVREIIDVIISNCKYKGAHQ